MEKIKQTETVNPMCLDCGKFGGECPGTTEKVWTGCIYKTQKNRGGKSDGRKI